VSQGHDDLLPNPHRADIDSSDESDVEEDVDQPSAHKTKHDLMMKGEGSRKGSFFKQAKKSYPMFPAPEERIKWDEYGEIIKYVSNTNCLGSMTLISVVTVSLAAKVPWREKNRRLLI
jgi:hypothetical protein